RGQLPRRTAADGAPGRALARDRGGEEGVPRDADGALVRSSGGLASPRGSLFPAGGGTGRIAQRGLRRGGVLLAAWVMCRHVRAARRLSASSARPQRAARPDPARRSAASRAIRRGGRRCRREGTRVRVL